MGLFPVAGIGPMPERVPRQAGRAECSKRGAPSAPLVPELRLGTPLSAQLRWLSPVQLVPKCTWERDGASRRLSGGAKGRWFAQPHDGLSRRIHRRSQMQLGNERTIPVPFSLSLRYRVRPEKQVAGDISPHAGELGQLATDAETQQRESAEHHDVRRGLRHRREGDVNHLLLPDHVGSN